MHLSLAVFKRILGSIFIFSLLSSSSFSNECSVYLDLARETKIFPLVTEGISFAKKPNLPSKTFVPYALVAPTLDRIIEDTNNSLHAGSIKVYQYEYDDGPKVRSLQVPLTSERKTFIEGFEREAELLKNQDHIEVEQLFLVSLGYVLMQTKNPGPFEVGNYLGDDPEKALNKALHDTGGNWQQFKATVTSEDFEYRGIYLLLRHKSLLLPTLMPLSFHELNIIWALGIAPLYITNGVGIADGIPRTPFSNWNHDSGHKLLNIREDNLGSVSNLETYLKIYGSLDDNNEKSAFAVLWGQFFHEGGKVTVDSFNKYSSRDLEGAIRGARERVIARLGSKDITDDLGPDPANALQRASEALFNGLKN